MKPSLLSTHVRTLNKALLGTMIAGAEREAADELQYVVRHEIWGLLKAGTAYEVKVLPIERQEGSITIRLIQKYYTREAGR